MHQKKNNIHESWIEYFPHGWCKVNEFKDFQLSSYYSLFCVFRAFYIYEESLLNFEKGCAEAFVFRSVASCVCVDKKKEEKWREKEWECFNL